MSWVLGEVDRRITSLDVWFFDLDDTHTPSPAKRIARKGVGVDDVLLYIGWCLETGVELAFEGEEGKIRSWERYVSFFLDTPSKREEAVKYINGFYSGVEDFVGMLNGGMYVTRSIQEVASNYGDRLGIGAFGEVKDKAKFVDAYLSANSWIRSVGVEGDSLEDGEMADVARAYGKETVAIYVSKTKRIETGFDIATSRDHSGLVTLLDSNI